MNPSGMIWKDGDYWYGAVAGDDGIVWLGISESRDLIEKELATKIDDTPIGASTRRNLLRLQRELHEYNIGKRKKFTVSVAPSGTEFEKEVWEALMHIPFGKCETYGDLAKQIGRPDAARAVGQAAGKNPVPIIIPCHRLLAAENKLGGFSMGPELKKKLLKLECIDFEED